MMNTALDDLAFERLYSHLFATLLIEQSTPEDKWRYDALDSKYPTIDGILRRETEEAANIGNEGRARKEQFIFVQLKGTRHKEGENPFPRLQGRLDEARERINTISRSAPALLIGVSVCASRPASLKSIYFAAPDAYLAVAGMKASDPIDPTDLVRKMAAMLDSRESGSALPITSQETIFFRKGPNGWFSIKDGLVAGQDICLNWTVPEAATRVSAIVKRGRPTVAAIPVKLPRAPYDEIKTEQGGFLREPIKDQPILLKRKLVKLPDVEVPHWVVQIQFPDEKEGVVEVKAFTK